MLGGPPFDKMNLSKGGFLMETKLNYKRTFLIGLAFLSICSFWQMYDNIIPLILQNTYHLGETMSGHGTGQCVGDLSAAGVWYAVR